MRILFTIVFLVLVAVPAYTQTPTSTMTVDEYEPRSTLVVPHIL